MGSIITNIGLLYGTLGGGWRPAWKAYDMLATGVLQDISQWWVSCEQDDEQLLVHVNTIMNNSWFM
jgi:hypothetical protein